MLSVLYIDIRILWGFNRYSMGIVSVWVFCRHFKKYHRYFLYNTDKIPLEGGGGGGRRG
jgi:hypothetical protein